ncbi:MAG: hypothetical protein EXS16_06815 [Gemmataceae bacterium]|nr:hypothetical protein [Gemmataceae bacterium]
MICKTLLLSAVLLTAGQTPKPAITPIPAANAASFGGQGTYLSPSSPTALAGAACGPNGCADGCNGCGIPWFGFSRPGNACASGGFLSKILHCQTPKDKNGNGDGKDKNGNGKDDAKDKNGNGDAKADDEKKDDEGPWRIFPNEVAGFKTTGWMYGTGVYNASNSSGTRYNGPMSSNDQEGVYLNQLWLNVNRPLKESLSWGANLDFMFGNDFISSQSRGFENANNRGWLPAWNRNTDYGITIPQAYVEVGTTKASLKVGHFYTPHGYMVIQAPSNFFNTLPWGFMMTNPYTHWGALGTANLSDDWTVMAGIVNGWDALDRPVNEAAVLAGVKYNFQEKKGFLSVNVMSGREPENLGAGYANRTLVTTVLDYKLTDDFNFVFEQNIGWQQNNGLDTDVFYNFSPYAFYKINDRLKAGLRYEYFRDPSGFTASERVNNPNNGPIPANNLGGPYSGTFQTIAVGLNWAPCGSSNLMIRPEIRYDWFQGTGTPFNAGQSKHQVMLVLGAFYQF